MTEQEFWAIIQQTKEDAGDDAVTQQALITESLTELEPQDIIDFEALFSNYVNKAYDWKLWAAAYIIDGGCSDDGFFYFRSGLVAQGREVYENALADPDSLVNLEHVDVDEWEAFGYCAREAYESATGGSQMPDGAHSPSIAIIEHPAEPTGQSWDEEDEDAMKAMLPKLCEKYWE